MFENASDMGEFVDGLMRVAERGLIEVHSMALLTTHYHLLVCSPGGELARALHELQLAFVRWFNRSRERDGPLMRGRYGAWPVDSLAYRRAVVSYIDRNPVQAGLARTAGDYPFGSACHYLAGSGPSWLTRDWVEAEVCDALGLSVYAPERYPEVFHGGFAAARDSVVEARLRRGVGAGPFVDPTDSLLRGASPAILSWMRYKARLADGTRPGQPVLPPCAVAAAGLLPGAPLPTQARRRWLASTVGRQVCLLLRDLAGSTYAEIATLVGGGGEAIRRAVNLARVELERDGEFAKRTADLGHELLVRTFGAVGAL
ncbi:MAG: hypothetical protein R3F29_08450 [Planctomycetota bacterium]